MAAFYTVELGGVAGTSGVTGTLDGFPVVKPASTTGTMARTRMSIGTYTLSGTAITTADTLNIAVMPAGSLFQFGMLTAGVSLATSTLAIGIAGTTGKYRAAAVFTAVDTPTPFAVSANFVNVGIAADERIIGTIAVASLPTTGQILRCAMVYTNG